MDSPTQGEQQTRTNPKVRGQMKGWNRSFGSTWFLFCSSLTRGERNETPNRRYLKNLKDIDKCQNKKKREKGKKVIVSFGALPVANCPIWNIPGKKKLILSPFIFIFPFVSFLSWFDRIIKHTRNFGLASFWGLYFLFFNVGCPLCVYFDSCEIPLDSFLHLEEMKLLVSCTHTHKHWWMIWNGFILEVCVYFSELFDLLDLLPPPHLFPKRKQFTATTSCYEIKY